MTERNAKVRTPSRSVKSSAILMVIFLIQVVSPVVVSEDGLDEMVICQDDYLGGECDSRFDASDGTSNVPSWVEGMFNFNMTSPTEIQFQASWAIREWDRSGMGLFDGLGSNLELDNINDGDGLPADVLRSSFDENSDPDDPGSPTVEDTLLSEIDGSIGQFLSGWGGSSTPETDWTDRVYLPDSSGAVSAVDCTIDPAQDGDGNAFEPPICISTTVNISLNIGDTYGISGVNAENLNTALEGMLVMGSQVTAKFDVLVSPGHKGTYAIHPPEYASVTQAGGNGGSEVGSVDGAYQYGLWEIDNRQPSAGLLDEDLPGDLDMTMGFRQSVTTSVVSIGSQAKSLDLRVEVDMSDENNAFVEVVAGIYQIQTSTLDSWGVKPLMDKDKATIPFITSDGIRMAYHTGLLDLSEMSQKIPVGDIGQAVANSKPGLNVQMGPFKWISNSQSPQDVGGLNYTHSMGCMRGVHFCLEGALAMEDNYPVYMTSTSHTFPFSLADLLGGNLGADVGFLNSVTGDDLGKLLNSGLEFSTVLSDDTIESFVGGMLPVGVSADLTMAIVLPSWASTADGGSTIELSYRVSGAHDGSISLAGSDSFSWQHAICSETSADECNDLSEDRVCASSLKTCAYADVELDVKKLSFASLPISKGVTVEFELTIDLAVHRIAVPESLFDSLNSDTTTLGLEVLPSDLLRVILDVGSRGDPLEIPFEICKNGKSYCDQSLPISNDNATGLTYFTSKLENDIQAMIEDGTSALSSNEEFSEVFGTLDMSGFSLEIGFPDGNLFDDDSVIGDERGIVFSLKIPMVSFAVGVGNSWMELISMARGEEGEGLKIDVITKSKSGTLVAPFLDPMVSAMSGLTNALAGSLVSPDGIRGPSNFSVGMPSTTVGPEEMDMHLGGAMTLILPLGIELEGVSSNGGAVESRIDEESRRQVITYKMVAGEEMPEAELEFGVLLTPMWVLTQVQFYLMGMLLFFLWRVRRKSVRRKKKRRAIALEKMEEAAASNVGYVAPQPTVEVLQVTDNGIVIKRRLSSA